ncbi:MAG: FKBP-type peptidyl-prolyl cis-trans isomerase [Bacteroidota bacterium]
MLSVILNYLEEQDIDATEGPEGLRYVITEKGTGELPKQGEFVTVHYRGKLVDTGEQFDASYDRDQPFSFSLGAGQVIRGWDIGIPLIPIGGKGTLYLPANIGYGERGAPPSIPGNAALMFEVEVLSTMDEAEYRKQQAEEQRLRREAFLRVRAAQMEKEKGEILAFAEKKKLTLEQSESGLFYTIKKEGTGKQAAPGTRVAVHYTGYLLNEEVFDTSLERGQPIAFPMGEGKVIPGWEEGIGLLKEGGKAILLIPSPLGYGPRQVGPIPPNSVLVFEVELVSVS